MSMFRTQNRVPEVYPNMSRDFQILGRALDMVQNGVKYNIDGITDVLNTDICDSSLLSLLQLKLGFYSDKLIPDDDLRIILKAFPHIKFYKGSIKGIKRALNTYLKIRPTKLDSIRVTNRKYVSDENGEISYYDVYNIDIIFAEQAYDLYILDEILKFIVPPGYNIRYTYAKYCDRNEISNLEFNDVVIVTKLTNSVWGEVSSDNRISNNALIRNISTVDFDTGDEFNSEVKILDNTGFVNRSRTAINIGTIPHLDYAKVNLQGGTQ